MQPISLVVISRPGARHLSVLDSLPPEVRINISDDPAVLAAAAPEAEVVLNCTGKAEGLEPILARAGRLRWIHSLAAGVEHQLIPELVASPVPLTNSRGIFRESLGEFVLAAALFFAKDLRRMVRNQEAGRWEQFDIEEVSRQTLGVIGFGEIGRAAARRCKALGMKVLAFRRRANAGNEDGLADRFFEAGQLGDMIAASDVVLVSAPLTPETRGLVGAAEIARMKPTAILVNVGRGPVISETALAEALQSRRIRGAALDVFDEEPLPAGHPFWGLDNLLLSPHCADHTSDWLEQAMEFFVQNFRRFLAGEPLLNLVDKRAGY